MLPETLPPGYSIPPRNAPDRIRFSQDVQAFRPQAKNAFIKVLPKPGKDPLGPGSQRLISLIDQGMKIMSKILADRLSSFLPQLIGPLQEGFIKVRSAVSNIRN